MVGELFEDVFENFLDRIFEEQDWENAEGLKTVWEYFYQTVHIFCNHNDADGDGKPDNCLYEYLTVTTEYSYYYDDNWQLTKCIEEGQYKGTTTYEYWYDEDGNRTKYVKYYEGQAVECYTYVYNSSNQLTARVNERFWTDNVTYYTYDADGNMISESTGLMEKTYEYTAENRLSVVRLQGQVLMAALYDGDGNKLFSMDYTGGCDNLCGHEGCSFEECIFHNLTFEDFEIWIPDCEDAEGSDSEDRANAVDAMKELASLVSMRAHKDYTITEYVNDNRENEEVLAELNIFGRTTKAYIYGNERIAYDTGEDTSYYLYDGTGSVSRISTEWGRVKETYDYDPYGNLTLGIPDSVNYYGYNGESTSLVTGLQYLRARYYNMENGSFLSEDNYLGTTSKPLTRNRYIYASNNPVNFIDPSGHWSINKFISDVMDKASDFVEDVVDFTEDVIDFAVDTTAKVVDTVGDLAKSAGTFMVNTYNTIVHAVTHPKETLVQVVEYAEEKKEEATEWAETKWEEAKQTYSDFKTYAEERTEEIKAAVNRQLCTVEERITDTLGKVDWESVGKIVAGGAIIAGLGVLTVCTGGAVGVIAAGALAGAAVSGGIGAVTGGVASVACGGTFLEGAADGFLTGTVTGAITGAVTAGIGTAASGGSTLLSNPLAQNVTESAVDVLVDTGTTLAQGGEVSLGSMAFDLVVGTVTGGADIPNSSKLDDVVDALDNKQVKNAIGDIVEESLDSKQAKEALGDAVEEITESKYRPIQPYEVTTYEEFRKRSVVGDGLEGHELWQHSNLKENGYATTRLSTEASKQNVVMALPHDVHVEVNKAQYSLNAKAQEPIENIIQNAEILYNHESVPNSSVDEALKRALEHYEKIMK